MHRGLIEPLEQRSDHSEAGIPIRFKLKTTTLTSGSLL
jgi:hypothetical protein